MAISKTLLFPARGGHESTYPVGVPLLGRLGTRAEKLEGKRLSEVPSKFGRPDWCGKASRSMKV